MYPPEGHVPKCLIIFSIFTSSPLSCCCCRLLLHLGIFAYFLGLPVPRGISGHPEERACFYLWISIPLHSSFLDYPVQLFRIALQDSTKPRSSFRVCLWGFWPVSEENTWSPSPMAVLPGLSGGAVLGIVGQGWPFGQGHIRFVEKNVKLAATQGLLTGCVVFGHTSQPVLFAQMDTCGNQARIICSNFLPPAWVCPEKQFTKYTVVRTCCFFFFIPLFHGRFAVSWGLILPPPTYLLVTFPRGWLLAFQSELSIDVKDS